MAAKLVSTAPPRSEGLPDYLRPGLDVVFVGINPGLASAARGHHYAGPGNHFWPLLYEAGFVPEPLTYEDDWRTLDFGGQRGLGIEVEWLDAAAVRGLETWLTPEAVGGASTVERQLEAYPFALALAQAAEHHGVEIRTGEVTGVLREGDRAVGVRVGGEELAAGAVLVATGPWAVHAGAWMGLEVPVSPLRGQIVHLAPPAGMSMPQQAIFHDTGYLLPKAGGDLLAGTTQELAGFDARPTAEGQNGIMEAVVRLAPALIDAPIRDLTACLRPSTPDGLPIIGAVEGWRDLYLSTGHEFKGITLALVSGKSLAQLMTGGAPDVALDDYSPARFAGAR